MGQLGTLVWKNFQFVRRHPIKAILMLLLPVLCLGFLGLIIYFDEITNVGDCDYQTIALFPSNPAFLVGSLACQQLETCVDNITTYQPPQKFLNAVLQNPDYINSCHLISQGKKMLNMFGDINMNTTNTAAESEIKNLTLEREKYSQTLLVDFIFNGKILYYGDASAPEIQSVVNQMIAMFDPQAIVSSMAPNMMMMMSTMMNSTNGTAMNLSTNADNNGERNKLMNLLTQYSPLSERVFGFGSQQAAVDYAQQNNSLSDTDGLIWGMVEFKDLGKNIRYKLVSPNGMRNTESALYLQSLIEAAIIKSKTGSASYPEVMLKLMPNRCHKDKTLYDVIFSAIGFALCFGLMMFAYTMASEMCYEKAAGLVEFLMIAGVPRWKLKLSWFIYGLPFVLFIGFAMSVIIKFIDKKMVEHTPFTILLLFLLLYCLALLCMCFCIASLLSTPQRAGIVMFVLLLSGYLTPQWGNMVPQVGYEGGTMWFVRYMCFVQPVIGAEIGMAYILQLEKINKGLAWSDLGASPDSADQFGGVKEILLLFIIQCFMFMLLSWYFDHVAPSKYGLKWPVFFCCMPSYWGCSNRDGNEGEEGKHIQSDIEPAPDKKEVGISVRNLSKSYGRKKIAVDHLSVSFYKNEITALLGHNGAGKSTTMNMLTGMIGPTSGTALIGGHDITNEMDHIRQTLGFCPQYDIIYPELSVRDHMKFYGDLKGLDKDKVMQYATEMFQHMKMLDALDRPAMKLSGGMKRKLSIAISFLGDPTIVVLDEPTSAIDPFSRRAIWDTILNYRSKSTILVSTHYMQEADVLGDRIAIIDQGQLRCFGSPMYLKSRYGSGSTIFLAHHKNIEATNLCKELQAYCPVTLVNSSRTETVLGVSIQAVRSPRMVECFEYLEENKDKLGIESFGISESTMEQVFFRVAEGGGTPEHDDHTGNAKPLMPENQPLSGVSLWFTQLLAVWIKRFHLARKSIIALVFQVFAPMLFMVILLLISRNFQSLDIGGEVKQVHLWTSSESQQLFYAGQTNTPLADSLKQWSLGSRCLNTIANLNCSGQGDIPEEEPYSDMGPTCNCSICDGYGGDPVHWARLTTGDNITNLNGRNITDFLLKINSDENIVAGIQVIKERNMDIHVLWAGEPIRQGGRPTEEQLAMRTIKSSFLNSYNNLLLRSRVQGSSKTYGITMESETQSFEAGEISGIQAVQGILMGFFGALALMMPIFTVLLFLVTENSSGNKQLQFLMGMNAAIYWIANFMWDMVIYLISALLMCGFMALFPDTFDIDIKYFLCIAIMYGISMIMLSYIFTFIMSTSRMAILLMGMIAPFFSMACMILLTWANETWYPDTIFALNFIPPCYITDSLMTMEFNKLMPAPLRAELLSWDKLNKRFAMSGLFSLTMLILLVLIESGLLKVIKRAVCCESCNRSAKVHQTQDSGMDQPIDPDVKAEEDRILHQADSTQIKDVLKVKRLTKTYKGGKTAVKGVSVGVHKGECFGLLGVNGAGKTTMFQMLTGYHPATSGQALIMGHSIFGNQSKISRHVSYCPQQDVLFESLTPLEHLHLYSRIRGIQSDDRCNIIPNLVGEIGLSPHQSKQSHALSGGNKRKLNFAIAVLGFPDVVFLDEMTTGMDPKARRAAWNVLEIAIANGSAAIITSHSMEECESLCKRLVIMVNGRFKCIGGVQYLKDKYGNNYNAKFRLGPNTDPHKVLRFMIDKFSQTNLVEQHVGYVEVEIPATSLTLSHLFKSIHELKEEDDVEVDEFSVSQTTLEHVFVNMVREQE